MNAAVFLALASTCAPTVAPTTALALVHVESALNPYAIGVVGGMLDRQPRDLTEATATAQMLRSAGWNFSVGLAQINVGNLDWLGLSLAQAFEPCANLRAMEAVLGGCFDRATRDRVNRPGF